MTLGIRVIEGMKFNSTKCKVIQLGMVMGASILEHPQAVQCSIAVTFLLQFPLVGFDKSEEAYVY